MKAALFLFVVCSAQLAHATPTVTDFHFDCKEKLNVNDKDWKVTDAASASMGFDGLHVYFSGSAMDSIATTETGGEYKVEAQCPGWITLSDNKPFKIKAFAWNLEFVSIGQADGKIKLVVNGQTSIPNTNQTDSFTKTWQATKKNLDAFEKETDSAKKATLDPFAAQKESETLCSNQLKLRFDELHGIAERSQSTREPSEISILDLFITIDPC